MPVHLGVSLGLSCALAALALPASADTAYTLNLKAKPLSSALIDLVTVTDISIGGVDPAQCGAAPRNVSGSLTPAAALRSLLVDSKCEAKRVNAKTYRLALKTIPAKTAGASTRPRPVPVADEAPEQVTVVAGRRPQTLGNAPSAVSVVGSNILGSNDHDLADIAARVPGMTVTNLGPGRDKILLRGVSDSILTGRTQSTVGLYLDDTPITYNAPDPDLLLIDMARVEVLKGPQGALYGQGSLSGVVRLVSNKPDLTRIGGDISASAGFTENGDSSSRVSAVINLPLLKDRLGVRAVVYHDESGGFIHDLSQAGKATNSTRRSGSRLAVKWQLSDDLIITISNLSQQLGSENSQYVTGKTGPYRREVALAEPHKNRLDDTIIGVQNETPVGTLKLSLSQARHRLVTGYDAQPLARVVTVPNSGVLFYDEEQDVMLSTGELSLVSPSEQRLRWMGGLFIARSGEHFEPHLIDVFTHADIYNERRSDGIHDFAAFGELTYDLTPHWMVTAGLRDAQTRHTTDSIVDLVHLTGYRTNSGNGGLSKSHRQSGTLMVRYQPGPRSLFYVQYGDGYRTGGFNTTTLGGNMTPTEYSGDQLGSFEAGLRYRTPKNRVHLTLAAFNVRWRNIQSDQLRSTGLPVTVNVGDGVNTGVEFEGDWQVLPRLNLHAVAQLNDPRLDRPAQAFAADKNAPMPYIAKTSASLSADWNHRLGRGLLQNTATLSWRGGSPLNYGALRTVTMPSFSKLDLASAYTIGRMRYGARLDNVTGTRSNSFAYGNPFTVSGANQVTPLRPPTLWVSLGYSY